MKWIKAIMAIGLILLLLLPTIGQSAQGSHKAMPRYGIRELKLGDDAASCGGSTEVVFHISVMVDIFSVGTTWSGSSPRWAAAIVLTGLYDDAHHRFAAFGRGREYRTESGTAGYNGYDFKWGYTRGIEIHRVYGTHYYDVEYNQKYKVRYWYAWGTLDNGWDEGTLSAQALIHEDYM
ncbi:MAG: hypothetical protein J7J42_03975 [Thermoplasmata archaeon]|nr:hypothetical protein [Thermoplasmata archaeon]